MKTPTETRPKITNTDIRDGFVTRYFTQMVSTKKIYEIDNTQYDIFVNNPYYITIKLSWTISGNINTDTINGQRRLGLLDKNRETVDYYNKTMPGLNRKLRNPGEYNFGKNNETNKYNTMVTNTIDGYTPTTVSDTIVEPVPDLVTDGLRIYYDYSDPTCYTPNPFNTINDLSLSGYNITAAPPTLGSQFYFDSSDYGGSFVFNPTSDPGNEESVIDISNSVNAPYYTANPTVTFDFWLKLANKTGAAHTIFGTEAGGTTAGRITIQAVPNAAGTIGYFRVNKGAFGIQTADFSGSYTYAINTPINLTITKTGFVYQLYVNGEFKTSKTDGTSTTYNFNSHALGQNWNPGAPTGQKAVEKFDGSMYTFMAYNRVLSSAEILQNYNHRKGRFNL